jgi:hypothetical protein
MPVAMRYQPIEFSQLFGPTKESLPMYRIALIVEVPASERLL